MLYKSYFHIISYVLYFYAIKIKSIVLLINLIIIFLRAKNALFHHDFNFLLSPKNTFNLQK